MSGKSKRIDINSSPVPAYRYFKELASFFELGTILARRDLVVRFKNTTAGVLWLVLRPLIMMGIMTFVFGKLSGFEHNSIAPYPLVVFAALIPWQFFAGALTDVTGCFFKNWGIVTNVYFPRLIMPISSLITCLVDLAISLVLLMGLFVWYGFAPSWQIVALPLFTALLMLFTFGVGVWLSILVIYLRDIQGILPFALQAGMYISPVGYRFTQVPENLFVLYNFNPLVGIMEGFRWSLLAGEGGLHTHSLLMSLGISLVLVCTGVAFFKSKEKNLVDIL